MTTFIKAKIKKSDDQTNIDKYRVDANITKYNFISKLVLLRIIHHIKIHVKMSTINMFKMDYGLLVTIIELLRFLHST